MSSREPLYAKVDFETSPRQWSNLRGYGVLKTVTHQDGKLISNSYMYNRLQPMTGSSFGDHLPIEGQDLQLNPQTDLAWATKN